MAYTSDDFLSAFQALLPRGPIWPRDPDSVQTKVLAALMPSWARLAERDENLLTDAFPAAPVELLPEWEASLGLPDPCAGESPTLQQRQMQVKARFVANGGQSVTYLTQFAALLGYTVTIDEFAPAIAGRLRAGEPANGAGWAFVWRVNLPGFTLTNFRAGDSAAGDALTVWGNAVVQCELERVAPAHTVVLFAQTAPFSNDYGGDID